MRSRLSLSPLSSPSLSSSAMESMLHLMLRHCHMKTPFGDSTQVLTILLDYIIADKFHKIGCTYTSLVHILRHSDIVCSLPPSLSSPGDVVLFAGATSQGAIIKFFDHSQFSHVAMVLKAQYTSQLLVWGASTNHASKFLTSCLSIFHRSVWLCVQVKVL